MAHAGSMRLSHELKICSGYGCSNQHTVCDLYLFFNVFVSAYEYPFLFLFSFFFFFQKKCQYYVCFCFVHRL
jgi:hypothetical protein